MARTHEIERAASYFPTRSFTSGMTALHEAENVFAGGKTLDEEYRELNEWWYNGGEEETAERQKYLITDRWTDLEW